MRPLTALAAGVLTVLLVACGGSSKSSSTPTSIPSLTSPTPRVSATVSTNATSAAGTPTTTATSAVATATSAPATATPEPATPTEVPPTEVPPTDTPPPPPPPTDTPVPPPPPTDTPVPPPPTATSVPSQGTNNTPTVTAKNINFTPASITVKSGAQVTITLSNQDSFVPHNLSVVGVKTNDCTGPCTATVSFVAPAPGNYSFQCTIHPSMTGTMTVVP